MKNKINNVKLPIVVPVKELVFLFKNCHFLRLYCKIEYKVI